MVKCSFTEYTSYTTSAPGAQEGDLIKSRPAAAGKSGYFTKKGDGGAMTGVLFSILAGAAMSIQGVMNARLGERAGTMEANVYVQVTAAALSALALCFYRTGSLRRLSGAPWYCWLGGALGLVITVCVMLGIRELSPGLSVSVILVAQLLTAAAVDALGLMGTEKTPLGWPKVIGAALMIAGVLVFRR